MTIRIVRLGSPRKRNEGLRIGLIRLTSQLGAIAKMNRAVIDRY
jgi:hypothetical protein